MNGRTLARRTLGAATGVVTLALVGAGSAAEWRAGGSRNDAIVRVSWSARPERVETCRRVPDAELTQRPAHMRRQFECAGTTARYRLSVLNNDSTVYTAIIRGGGLRHDRELYVWHDVALRPGTTRLSVRFVRLDSSNTPADGTGDENNATARPASSVAEGTLAQPGSGQVAGLADRTTREQQERARRRAEAVPPLLTLDSAVTLTARRVLLVTYDELRRELVAVDSIRSGRR